MRKLKLYWTYLKAQWQMFLEYRGDIFIFTLDGIIAPLVGLAVWLSVSASNINLALSSTDLITYFLMVFLVSTSTSAWGAYFISQDIRTGDFSKYLTKPFGMAEDYAIRNIAEKLHKLTFIIFVNIFLVLIFYNSFHLINIHYSFVSISLFIVALLIGSAIYFLMDITIGVCSFWFMDTDFMRGLHSIARDFLSGKIMPLILMPSFLSGIILFSPYRYVVSFPVEIFLNKLTTGQIIMGFGIEIFWFLTFLFLYKILYALGVKNYQGNGG